MSGRRQTKPAKGCRSFDKKVLKLCKLIEKRGLDKRVAQTPKGSISSITRRAQKIYRDRGSRGREEWIESLRQASAEAKGY